MIKKMHLFLVGILCVMLVGCGSQNASKDDNSVSKTAKYVTPEVVDGKITLDKSDFSDESIYVNYDSGNVVIQLIAVNASDGTSRISLNTCQSCSPSPLAYFAKEKGMLVCQNCGNKFTNDDVGSTASGCNPMNIEYEENDSQITVSVDILNQYENLFANWQGTYK